MASTFRTRLAIAGALLAGALLSAPAAAGVGGKTYRVFAAVSGSPLCSACFQFQADGTMFWNDCGSYLGTWTEVDFGLFGLWSFEASQLTLRGRGRDLTASGFHVLGVFVFATSGDYFGFPFSCWGFLGGCPQPGAPALEEPYAAERHAALHRRRPLVPRARGRS
jgi:hypothetical protein